MHDEAALRGGTAVFHIIKEEIRRTRDESHGAIAVLLNTILNRIIEIEKGTANVQM
jgi:hypothetical protein